MKLPKKVNVFGAKIKIKEQDRIDMAGLFEASKKLITVKRDEDMEDRLKSLYHELGHAVSWRTGIWQTVNHNHDLEELYVENFAIFMHEFIKDNYDWIFETYEEI